MTRYFFDATNIKAYLRTHGTVSGIQRIALEVMKYYATHHAPGQVYLCLWEKNQYKALPADVLVGMDGIDVDQISALLYGNAARATGATLPMLARYRSRPLKYQAHRLIANIQALRRQESYFTKRGSSLAEWRASLPKQKRVKQAPPPARPITELLHAGDQIIILGATWGMNGLDEQLITLKERHGAQVFLQIHDLIPLVMPQHLAYEFSLEFHRWLEASTRYVTRYVVAAQHTRRDLERFLAEIGQDRPIAVIPFASQLGPQDTPPALTTFHARSKALYEIPQDLRNKTKVPYVLVVGTLESRKNLWRLVQAWDRLTWDPAVDMPKLIFAGRQGWFNDDLMDWMRASGNLRGWVQFVDGPTDAELAYLYRNCLFTATVSLYEGWGLPIGESLSFGKTAVVADNSAMPEVGGDLVTYCDATSITSITAACRKLITDVDYRVGLEGKIAQTELRTWEAVGQDYLTALTA